MSHWLLSWSHREAALSEDTARNRRQATSIIKGEISPTRQYLGGQGKDVTASYESFEPAVYTLSADRVQINQALNEQERRTAQRQASADQAPFTLRTTPFAQSELLGHCSHLENSSQSVRVHLSRTHENRMAAGIDALLPWRRNNPANGTDASGLQESNATLPLMQMHLTRPSSVATDTGHSRQEVAPLPGAIVLALRADTRQSGRHAMHMRLVGTCRRRRS